MSFLESSIFNTLFNDDVPRIILEANTPDFTIVTYNEAHKEATFTINRDIKGMSLWLAYPREDNVEGADSLEKGLLEAINTLKPIKLSPFQYSVPSSDLNSIEMVWWQVEIEPILDANGKAEFVHLKSKNVTEQISGNKILNKYKEREETLSRELSNTHEELAASNEELQANLEDLLATNDALANSKDELLLLNTELENRIERRTKDLQSSRLLLENIIATANVAITLLKGKDLVIEMPNPKMLAIWQRNLEDVVGRKLVDVFPELEFQRFPKLLTDAFETGNRVAMNQIPAVVVDTKGKSNEIYVDFSYDPIFDSNGNVEYIMATVIDVTKQVESLTKLEQKKSELQAITEELAASNEELSATNEELATTNEELQEAQESLLIKNEELAETEENLNLALASGNLGIYSIDPSTGKFDISTKAREFYGLPLLADILWTDVIKTVVPEYLPVIEKARAEALAKHIPFDVQYPIIQGSTGIKKWIRVVGKSIPKTKFKAARFLGVIIDITKEVEHRLVIEESEDRFRNMAEATDVYISVGDLSRNATYFNNAWVKLTGRSMKDLVESGYLDLVHPEDRNIYMDAYNKSFDKKAPFTGEFRLMGLDGEYRWLLAKGTPRFNNDGIFMGYISSSVDITELKKDELRKNDFIGMVSHELKTPLTAISGFVQVLQSRARKSEDTYALNALNRAYNQIRKMTTMINGFLNVSRLESGKLLIEKNTFRLDELLVELIEESDVVQFSHQIVLTVDEPIEVNADRDKIGSVVSNLLSNAVKYSPAGTRIDVNCKILNNKAFVSVSDNGIGIDKVDLEKLFDRYYRVGKHHTVSGFGIGLYLSAEIIQRHNGIIGVDSEVDKGSTFYFEIPLSEN
ncbi:PAS domain S-box protein [Pedobacter lithocola]|uniref:histidine kinase n=1 Tax=Pedobacter lithocola TaxID=1908239 RepID=A0ABV8P4K6_9SPHI